MRTAMHMVNSMLWPSISFGGEVIHSSKTDAKRLKVVQKKTARQLLGTAQCAGSDMVRGELGWIPVSAQRDAQQLRFLHRLQSMPDGRLAKEVFRDRVTAFNASKATGSTTTHGFCTNLAPILDGV